MACTHIITSRGKCPIDDNSCQPQHCNQLYMAIRYLVAYQTLEMPQALVHYVAVTRKSFVDRTN